MFGFRNDKINLRHVSNGQVVKYRGKYGTKKRTILFEFGHFEDNTVYWQADIVVLSERPQNDYVILTSKIVDDTIYEQRPFDDNGGTFDYPTPEELIRYDQAVDLYYVKLWNGSGKLSKTDVHQRKRFDNKISMMSLYVNPPKYLFAKSNQGSTYIFEFGRVSYGSVNNCAISSNGYRLYNDKITEKPGEISFFTNYDCLIELREATETEKKLLFLQAVEAHKKAEKTKKMDFSELLNIEEDTMLYAYDGIYEYVFPYGGHKRIEGITSVVYNDGCMKEPASYDRNFRLTYYTKGDSPYKKTSVGSLDNFKILRKATDEEIELYEKAKEQELEFQEILKKKELQETTKRDFESRLRPFVTKVLVSHGKDDVWRPAIFGCILESFPKYMIVGGIQYEHCLPYQKYRHLLGKKFNSSDMP